MKISNKQDVQILNNILSIEDADAKKFLGEAFYRYIANKQHLINEGKILINDMKKACPPRMKDRRISLLKENLKQFEKGVIRSIDLVNYISDLKNERN